MREREGGKERERELECTTKQKSGNVRESARVSDRYSFGHMKNDRKHKERRAARKKEHHRSNQGRTGWRCFQDLSPVKVCTGTCAHTQIHTHTSTHTSLPLSVSPSDCETVPVLNLGMEKHACNLHAHKHMGLTTAHKQTHTHHPPENQEHSLPTEEGGSRNRAK